MAACRLAIGLGFVTMKLRHGAGQAGQILLHLIRRFVDVQQHRSHEGRQAAGQFDGPVDRYQTRTARVTHETDRVHTGRYRSVDILLAGQS